MEKRTGHCLSHLFTRPSTIRILDAKKSRYYDDALKHVVKAREYYLKAGKPELWDLLVERIRNEHGKKRGFIGDFEVIAAGRKPESLKSPNERLREKWETMIR